MSVPLQPVKNTFQPPLSGGSFLARRATTEPQSITCSSRFMPILRNMSAPTAHSAVSTGRSLTDSSTTFSPL